MRSVKTRRRRRARKHKAVKLKTNVESKAKGPSKQDHEFMQKVLSAQSSVRDGLISSTFETVPGGPRVPRKVFGSVSLNDHTRAHIGDTYIQPRLAHVHVCQHSSEVHNAAQWSDTAISMQHNRVHKRFRGLDDSVSIRQLSPICGQGGLSVETHSAALCAYARYDVFKSKEIRTD